MKKHLLAPVLFVLILFSVLFFRPKSEITPVLAESGEAFALKDRPENAQKLGSNLQNLKHDSNKFTEQSKEQGQTVANRNDASSDRKESLPRSEKPDSNESYSHKKESELIPVTHYTDSGPSIGSVKVLGHRGCDTNTQGWFLSVGRPDQYRFSISEDGETLEVEPIANPLEGGFEFVHCADPGEFNGKRVRFSALVKASQVTGEARLRLRGENIQKKMIIYEKTQLFGDYDWKEVSVEAEVDDETALFSYGLTFRSPGKLWLSLPRFGIVKK